MTAKRVKRRGCSAAVLPRLGARQDRAIVDARNSALEPTNQLLHPLRAWSTARMISDTSTLVPLGMPCGHAEVRAVPRTMFTRTMMSLTATVPEPLQSPTHGTGAGVGVEVGETPTVLLTVAVVVSVVVAVAVCGGAEVAVALGLAV